MRTVVHMSDIHFGRIDQALLKPLIEAVTNRRPDAVVISGDLTQRARPHEFQEARAFLDSLPKPQIVVPGNHDVPLHNIYARFRHALVNYCRYITEDLEPFFADQEMAILGLNTARSLTFKGGRINAAQLARIEERFCPLGKDLTKILVTHHPFDLPEMHNDGLLVGRSRMAMLKLAACGVDLLLAGHYHISSSGHTALRYKIAGHSAIFVQAGTASSTRGRGEANSFNVIQIEGSQINIERLAWDPQRCAFVIHSAEQFRRTPVGWSRGGPPP